MTDDAEAADQQVAADPFEIYLAWSNMTFTVLPGQTALQALIEAGVAVELGCQTGGCGMCVTAYVEGDIIHKVAASASPTESATSAPACRAQGRALSSPNK